MVKLTLNKQDINVIRCTEALSSKTSKKSKIPPTSLNPFVNDHYCDSLIIPSQISLFVDKYRPTNPKDLIGLDHSYYFLKKWYFQENNNFLLIIGPIGCGKTSLVHVFSKEYDINVFDIKNSDLIETKQDAMNEIMKFSNYSFSFGKKPNNKIILIDEYQNSQNDLLTITDIQNLYLLKDRIPKVIIISADAKGSKLSDLKKVYDVHYINEINKDVLKEWVNKIITLEQLNKSFIDNIEINSDKRLLLNNLQYLAKGKHINTNKLYKDQELDVFHFVNKLFDTSPMNINEMYNAYDTDGYMIANLVHENYTDYSTDIFKIADAAEHISNGDCLLSKLYSTQYFSPEFHCLESMIYPSYFARADVKQIKEPLRNSIVNNRLNILLNNRKIVDKINLATKVKLSIDEILYFKSCLKRFIVKNKKMTINQQKFIYNLMELFKSSKIETLELFYKHFGDFTLNKNSKSFTTKFKQYLMEIQNQYNLENLKL
jgi:DNA polymerase III delta prime subunit